jgi:hypothetical protein
MPDTGISVLVLYENFAIGAAVQRRLLDVPMVHMVRAESAAACEGSYDVVVMCPYLREHRRTEVLRRWAGHGRRAEVIELEDVCGAAGVRMLVGRSDSGPAHAAATAATSVVEASTVPVAARVTRSRASGSASS